MNEYAATAMLMNAAAGERILVIERDGRAVRQAVESFRQPNEAYAFGAQIRIANGAESVRLPSGGRISFATPRGYHRMRGQSVDVVFIDNDAHRVLGESIDAYDRFRLDVALVLKSTNGRVVHS
ncbi:hypothetical protein J2Y69_003080 [Microbacterium resistens]|uniref:Uncharacterized protein n=1 Tax=Microbacterium resistens TaxID=156977 RepID=A0ABU1SFU2_9MICO|nr:hypothetical protein [Microbacterium resistens]MDR6868464.1 hypothetical protein [Microbacterium resistens]